MSNPKVLAPIVILVGAALVLGILYLSSSVPAAIERPSFAPLVVTKIATPQSFQFVVRAHGSVSPRSESDLIPQVSGEVVAVSPALAAGGFFEQGETLVRIERADYEASLESARASLARADSEYGRARKERNRQRTLADRSVASQSRIDDAETAYRVAFASLREARARLGQAERDLDRTEIRAPYRGRVRSETVAAGQFVQRGTPIAKLYAIDFAEVRLPLPDRELAFLDLPLAPYASRRRAEPLAPLKTGGVAEEADAVPPAIASDAVSDEAEPEPVGEGPAVEAQLPSLPEVVLRAEFAGGSHSWKGSIVRTEGEIDAHSRMVHVVAQIADPYGIDDPNAGATPLAVGLFVEAEIFGREVAAAYVLPRIALRADSRVYVVDAESKLHFRDVEVLRIERETVVVGKGLSPGDRVCVSALSAAVDGMSVRERDEATEVAGATP